MPCIARGYRKRSPIKTSNAVAASGVSSTPRRRSGEAARADALGADGGSRQQQRGQQRIDEQALAILRPERGQAREQVGWARVGRWQPVFGIACGTQQCPHRLADILGRCCSNMCSRWM
jgi:hypothetical protein